MKLGILQVFGLAVILGEFLIGTVAHANGKILIYSYRDPWTIQPLVDLFEQQTGITVEVQLAKDDILDRLQKEGSESSADIIFTVDIGRLDGAKQQGFTQAVSSDALDSQIPEQYRDPHGHWFGLTARARVIYASKERVPEGYVQSYDDLIKPEWKGRICVRSGFHVYSLSFLSHMIANYGIEYAESWLIGLKANLARSPQGNDRGQVQAIQEGICDLSLGNSYYLGKMYEDPNQIAWARAVYPIFPNQESTGTFMNVSGMAMARHAPNPENALKFMEFLATDLAQQIYADQNFEYPVSVNVPWAGLVSSWGTFEGDTINLATVNQYRDEATELVKRVNFDE